MNDWYQEQWRKVITEAFDERFKRISDLTWLPWVGKDFLQYRVLIIAESHYTNTDDPALVEEKKREYMVDPFSTREVMAEYPLYGYDAGWKNHGARGNNPTFDNLTKILCGSPLLGPTDKELRFSLWSRIAFMNFIQRPMWYSKTHGKERPTGEDRAIGWRATLGVISILAPEICIFAGLEAAVWFNWFMKENGINATPLVFHNKIGRCCPRSSVVCIENTPIQFRFMRHPCSFFSWEQWKAFVFDGNEALQTKLSFFEKP